VTENDYQARLKRVRLLLWLLVAVAILGVVALVALRRGPGDVPQARTTTAQASFGGPFTLVGADGKPFSSIALANKPYAIYFGYTRCGDVCPTTLARLVKLRKEAGDEKSLAILFVTIDPENDGPAEVGQYAGLFNAPIIGLTGSKAQIERVKKQFGIFAQPEPMEGGHGMKMDHTATVLLFDRNGKLAGTIATDEPDRTALAKLKTIVA
jgi:protein SCO1/2